MRRFLPPALFLFLPSLAFAVIVGVSGVGSGITPLGVVARLDTATSSTNTTVSFPVSSGTNRYLIVGVEEEGSASTVTAAYGGESMSEIVSITDSDVETVTFFGLNDFGISNASGSNVVLTNAQSYVTVHIASYEGVNQSTPVPETDSDYTGSSTPNPVQLSITAGDNTAVVSMSGTGGVTTASWNAAMTEQTDQQSTSNTGSMADKIVSTGGAVAAECTWATQNRATAIALELAHD